ncbi:2TM domain-containing protein (plasmid) [Photobacterium sp. GJ3]|uniref:2TM domain-containing protein n=1 Tax=Photobacterium sp. GJ3 TaxID=2829502 RepID=UPI001B8BA2B1|nr:2TM domain-containing protein [Photobacterium sp. GJ3]QUJ70581.1 2TM domain-containing protein [Photobacterium sp. GJ3]
MIIRKLRLQRGWSQEQLAQLSGVSVRTIQRIERGGNAGLETLKSFAAVFEIDITELKQEPDMDKENAVSTEEERALSYVRDIKAFYSHLITYCLVIGLLFVINFVTDPSYIWAWWPAMGWGIGVAIQAASTYEWFNFFSTDWEKKQVEKRLGRKL